MGNSLNKPDAIFYMRSIRRSLGNGLIFDAENILICYGQQYAAFALAKLEQQHQLQRLREIEKGVIR